MKSLGCYLFKGRCQTSAVLLGAALAAPSPADADGPPRGDSQNVSFLTPADAPAFLALNPERVVRFGRHIGFSGEAHLLDERLSFSFSDTRGRDLQDGRRVLPDWQLDQNWQREAGFSFTLPNPGGFSVDISGGIYDARRPAAVRNPRLQVGYPSRWAEHQAADFALGIGVFNDRLRYQGGYARSRYRGALDYEAIQRRPDRWAISPSGGRGSARRHRIDADILSGGPYVISAFGLYESSDLEFRAGSRAGQTASFSGGQRRELGAQVSAERFSFEANRLDRRDPGRTQLKHSAKIGYRAVSLEVFRDNFRRGSPGNWTTREDYFGGNLSLDLEAVRGSGDGSPLRRLVPSEIRFGAERGRIYQARAPAEPRDVKNGLSLGMSWNSENTFTDLSIYRAATDSPPGSALKTALRDSSVDFSHSVFGDHWDMTGYISLGGFASRTVGVRSTDRWMLGGVTLSYYPEGAPDVSVAFDIDRFDGRYPDVGERYAERNRHLDVVLDFSKYLPENGSMQLSYHAVVSTTRDAQTGQTRSRQRAVSLTMGLLF